MYGLLTIFPVLFSFIFMILISFFFIFFSIEIWIWKSCRFLCIICLLSSVFTSMASSGFSIFDSVNVIVTLFQFVTTLKHDFYQQVYFLQYGIVRCCLYWNSDELFFLRFWYWVINLLLFIKVLHIVFVIPVCHALLPQHEAAGSCWKWLPAGLWVAWYLGGAEGPEPSQERSFSKRVLPDLISSKLCLRPRVASRVHPSQRIFQRVLAGG